jgi:hypothetical protein
MTRKRARSPDWTSFGTRVTPSALKWWAEQGGLETRGLENCMRRHGRRAIGPRPE